VRMCVRTQWLSNVLDRKSYTFRPKGLRDCASTDER